MANALTDLENGMEIGICPKSIPLSMDSEEPFKTVYEDSVVLFWKLNIRQNRNTNTTDKVQRIIFPKRG